MFAPSREKIEAAEHYLANLQPRQRGWQNTRGTSGHTRDGKPLWRQFPKQWHAEANGRLAYLMEKYWREHGHGPSQQKHASLIGNVVDWILNCRMTRSRSSKRFANWNKLWNARRAVSGGPFQPNPFKRERFTPRTSKARSSQGNLSGI